MSRIYARGELDVFHGFAVGSSARGAARAHYWDYVLRVWGHDSIEEFIAFVGRVSLNGVVERITVPFLMAHGAGDRQIPLEYAHRSYDQAVASPKRELRVFTAEEGPPSTSA